MALYLLPTLCKTHPIAICMSSLVVLWRPTDAMRCSLAGSIAQGHVTNSSTIHSVTAPQRNSNIHQYAASVAFNTDDRTAWYQSVTAGDAIHRAVLPVYCSINIVTSNIHKLASASINHSASLVSPMLEPICVTAAPTSCMHWLLQPAAPTTCLHWLLKLQLCMNR